MQMFDLVPEEVLIGSDRITLPNGIIMVASIPSVSINNLLDDILTDVHTK